MSHPTIKDSWLADNAQRVKAAQLKVDELLEIKGIVYRVRKLTPRDVVLRRYSGSLVIPKTDATATMLERAKPA